MWKWVDRGKTTSPSKWPETKAAYLSVSNVIKGVVSEHQWLEKELSSIFWWVHIQSSGTEHLWKF